MPGYANWEQLYAEEFHTLTQEGYDTESVVQPDKCDSPLPFPNQYELSAEKPSEDFWEKAYSRLWQIRQHGLRSDYPYVEPEEFSAILSEGGTAPALEPLTSKEYEKRIKGAIHGRIAGVVLGKPLEMGMSRHQIKEYLESVGEYPLQYFVSEYSEKADMHLRWDCIPSTRGNVAFVQPDDDIHYTLLALLLAEKKGFYFTSADVGYNWLDNVPYHWLWCASRQAYYHMVNLNDSTAKETQIAEIPTKINPWRECIDGQIRCDMWGYISPSDPQEAARMAYLDCAFSLTKNGCYGGMFVAGCIAAALSAHPTVDSILLGGLSVIPQKSRLAEAVRFVQEKYQKRQDWESVCACIEQKYGNLPFSGTINNLAMVVLALLHGNLDYEKTITTAVMCGIDTDCNGGTAGSICGAAVGIDRIGNRWIEPFHDSIHSVISEFGHGSISDVIQRTIALQKRKSNIE